jgi:hypothetical protein
MHLQAVSPRPKNEQNVTLTSKLFFPRESKKNRKAGQK